MPMSLLSCSVRRFKRRGKRASLSDDANAPLFPSEESYAQAESNAAAWILTIAAYLKKRGGTSRTAYPTVGVASPRRGKCCAVVR